MESFHWGEPGFSEGWADGGSYHGDDSCILVLRVYHKYMYGSKMLKLMYYNMFIYIYIYYIDMLHILCFSLSLSASLYMGLCGCLCLCGCIPTLR